MVSEGIENCFMEVSSHGLDQKRITGLEFKGAIFTNLTHDHLDYHNTFKAYRDTKKILFDSLSDCAFALINIDDKNAKVMVRIAKQKYKPTHFIVMLIIPLKFWRANLKVCY